MKAENEKSGGGLANLANLANYTLKRAKQATSLYDETMTEHLSERAAILEYDGGHARKQAEAEARRALRVYEYRLIESPDTWLILIAPGCDLSGATRTCRNRFGVDRVLEVRKYKHL